MSSIPLHDALLGAKVPKDIASRAAEDVVQKEQLSELAAKADIANLETRLIRWMVGYGGLLAGLVIAAIKFL